MAPQPIILPLSRTRRRLYFRVLILVFVLAVPLLFLYATGYRFEGFTELVRTGGMYVGAERAGAEIYINGELVRETGTFRRAFFVQNLEPGTYEVRVTKPEYHPWEKTLAVYPHIVTEAQAFNMPHRPTLVPIPPTLETPAATAPSTVSNPLYERVDAAFATSTATSTLSTASLRTALERESTDLDAAMATTTKEYQDMMLFEIDGGVVAAWEGNSARIPFYFCQPEQGCADRIVLNTHGETPQHFDFFPGTADLVLVTLRQGVYVTELDNRSGQNIQPLIKETGADFRVVDGRIYLSVAERLYEVEI